MTLVLQVCLLDVLEAELRQTWTELKEQYGESNITTCKADVTNKSEFRGKHFLTITLYDNFFIAMNTVYVLLLNQNSNFSYRGIVCDNETSVSMVR